MGYSNYPDFYISKDNLPEKYKSIVDDVNKKLLSIGIQPEYLNTAVITNINIDICGIEIEFDNNITLIIPINSIKKFIILYANLESYKNIKNVFKFNNFIIEIIEGSRFDLMRILIKEGYLEILDQLADSDIKLSDEFLNFICLNVIKQNKIFYSFYLKYPILLECYNNLYS